MKIPQHSDELKELVDVTVDARAFHCPMPLLKAKQALNSMQAGQVLLLQASDSGSWGDIHRFVGMTKHHMLFAEQQLEQYVFYIKKGESYATV